MAMRPPAGWFHEVTSFSEGGASGGGGGGTHLAVNWWFHPPDNLDPSPAGFARPYSSEFWPAVWEGRRARYEGRGGGGSGAVGAAREEEDGQAGQQQQQQRQAGELGGPQQAEEEEEAAGGGRPHRRRLRPAPPFYGVFGIGRHAHLHYFVGVRSK